MPIPKPKAGEEKQKFIQRCMFNPTMVSEYPDRKQRYAICINTYKNK